MRRRSVSAALGAAIVLAAGCGGGDERQDADEPAGKFNVDVDARFPERQRLARQEEFVVRVRNADTKTIPNVAVTVESFASRADRQDLADPTRPTWIVDESPNGGVTAYTNTWALGELRPGQSKRFVWRVTPVKPGRHEVSYRVAAGLDGKAKAIGDGGGIPEGAFQVAVAGDPVDARVDPETGKVIRRPGRGAKTKKQ